MSEPAPRIGTRRTAAEIHDDVLRHGGRGARGHFLVPALVGNIIGGVTLVALLNFGQVSRGREGRARRQRSRPTNAPLGDAQ